jgi:hypothetical protein
VSYSVAFDRKALEALRQLDFELQEEVLDEIDTLAAAADALPRRPLPSTQIQDVYRERAGMRRYFFLTLMYDSIARVMTVAQIGYVTKPALWQ